MQPVDRILNIGVVREHDLADNFEDGLFQGHLFVGPLTTLLDLQNQALVAQILPKTHMNDISGEDLAELDCYIHFCVALALGLIHPLLEGVMSECFECLEHKDEPLLVECVSTCFSLRLPVLVVLGENERLADDLLEHDEVLRVLVQQGILAHVDVLGDLWIRDPDMVLRLEIKNQYWVLLSIKLLVCAEAHFARKVIHC